MRYSKKVRKPVAAMLMAIFASQILLPNVSLALTTGPTQPEVQSFEPVGTTDMVDMFTGDFNYNIPLLDVEGYPVNISYHGGINMEQEASWVGLGWNINPGVINRSVRGLPDDFNGDTIAKELNIKDEKTLRVGVGVGAEFFGVGDPLLSLSASLGANVTFNNYRGTSVDFNLGGGVHIFHSASVGVNIGVGSHTGADIDYNANLSLSTAQFLGKSMAGGLSAGVGQGFSTRSGIKDLNLSFSANANVMGVPVSQSFSNTIPIGVKNFVPVITNSNTMRSFSGRIKFGGELLWCLGYVTANGMFSKVHYNNDGSKDAYGYLYLQNSQNAASASQCILDFTRDHDGQFNKTMQYLPPANLTYDIYNASGQGTGGVFRPFRNDFGTVYDPVTKSKANSYSVELEAGGGWIFEVGGDYTTSETEMESGPWVDYVRSFTNKSNGSIYENTYLKQGGELTQVDPQYFSDIKKFEPLSPAGAQGLPAKKAGSTTQRDARGNLVYYFTAKEDTVKGVGTNPYIVNYTSTDGFAGGATPATTKIDRIGTTGSLGHKKDEISEIVQVQTDGRRYVYGLPAMNNIQKEATFAVETPGTTDFNKGIASHSAGDASMGNTQGIDHFYSSTTTPAYAHSYLLTSVLSADYMDVTGDGITDDDLGTYTRMNYSRKESDYRWRAPFESGKAQYDPGFRSLKKDDKGSVVSGSREQWMLHSIETRNYVAEFYTSQRNDACGSTEAIITSGKYAVAPYNTSSTAAKSYKLDSIKLFNKHDRFINKTSAVPIKTVFLVYTDTLCRGIPNVLTGGGSAGKLTLSKIYFKYGNSERSMISPYEFTYGYNPNYNIANKDRWGNYKPNNDTLSNYEFPFVNQFDASNDLYASAWSLTDIALPSGGTIHVNYESDEYGFVQDKVADEMFMIKGIGNGTGFNPSNYLYANENSPYLYLYFRRRHASEQGGSIADNYQRSNQLIYYNCNVKLNDANNNSYEQIKGYAEIEEIGNCPDGTYGYIKIKPVEPEGDEGVLNPITFTAINTARYNLPQVLFPESSSDPEEDFDILAGLRSAIEELVSILHNPVVRLVKRKHACRAVDLKKSFVRLKSPGLRKKGGGQRVKSLAFYDNWQSLAGGSEQGAAYGKTYTYMMKDDTYGYISSGVASYEPMIGGDENPFRTPVPFIIQSGSNFPPMDAVDLYQEMPIGESLFPPGYVGYRQVSVSSIHAGYGRSAQGVDLYKFYTAKDFPAKVVASGINTDFKHEFNIFSQKNEISATQGYSLIFNDMHGKPKSVEHYINHPGSTQQLVSYQNYNYKMSGGQLDNKVRCLVYSPLSHSMVVEEKQLGVEADVTLDSRYKNEATTTSTYNSNLNLSGFFIFIFPIFFAWNYEGDYVNNFKSATVTKVIQQYGILDNVQAYNEGAVTTMKNELFDPQTGQVVVTSINNEYQDKEYSTNIPGYWGYSGMSPSYSNIKYEMDIPALTIDAERVGNFPGATNLKIGDEVLLEYNYSGKVQVQAWIMGTDHILPNQVGCVSCCKGFILPRFPLNTPGWLPSSTISNAHITVIRSGGKNMLAETIENYTSMDNPVDGLGNLKASLSQLISIKARTYADSNTRIIRRYINNADTINPYAIGERGMHRLLGEYAYVADRNYSTPTLRNAGLFPATKLFSLNAYENTRCVQFPHYYLAPIATPGWQFARTLTKWSPSGKEVENKDAVGNYSTAVFGYNEDLPVAVASNSRQGEILAEGFEDFGLLRYKKSIVSFAYSPFIKLFDTAALSTPSAFYNLFKLDNASDVDIVSTTAHTGTYSLSVPVSSGGITGIYALPIAVNSDDYFGLTNEYNTYYNTGTFSSFTADHEYLPFKLNRGKKYILSFWVKQSGATPNITGYSVHDSCGMKLGSKFYKATRKSNIIDGWQQMETVFTVTDTATTAIFRMPKDYYLDDIRFFPADGNMKAHVYHPVNEKVVATLDENNFATMYEYDQEGNLVRTKRETEKGIITLSESRQSNHKK